MIDRFMAWSCHTSLAPPRAAGLTSDAARGGVAGRRAGVRNGVRDGLSGFAAPAAPGPEI